LFDYFVNLEAKVRIGGIMSDHITNDLFKVVVGGGGFSTIILFTSKQLFARKDIIQDRIRNEKFKQRFGSNILLYAEQRSACVT
jgi:hypothetical protein